MAIMAHIKMSFFICDRLRSPCPVLGVAQLSATAIVDGLRGQKVPKPAAEHARSFAIATRDSHIPQFGEERNVCYNRALQTGVIASVVLLHAPSVPRRPQGLSTEGGDALRSLEVVSCDRQWGSSSSPLAAETFHHPPGHSDPAQCLTLIPTVLPTFSTSR